VKHKRVCRFRFFFVWKQTWLWLNRGMYDKSLIFISLPRFSVFFSSSPPRFSIHFLTPASIVRYYVPAIRNENPQDRYYDPGCDCGLVTLATSLGPRVSDALPLRFLRPFGVHIYMGGDTQSRATLPHGDGWVAVHNPIIAFDPPPPVMVFHW
jgi:hypothetical protein